VGGTTIAAEFSRYGDKVLPDEGECKKCIA